MRLYTVVVDSTQYQAANLKGYGDPLSLPLPHGSLVGNYMNKYFILYDTIFTFIASSI